MKRLLVIALAALFFAALPAASGAAGNSRALCLGQTAFVGGGTEQLYFGEYEGAPVLCRVLSTTANDQKTPGLFVLSEYLLGKTMFDTKESDSNIWMASVARNRYCANFYESAFTDAERAAILETTYTDDKYSSPRHDWGKCTQTGDTVFFLSVSEAENPEYGFDREDDATRLAAFVGETEGQWWRLRSPSSDSYYDTSIVGPDGKIGRRSADHIRGARPAWNIDANAVLFSRPAESDAVPTATGTLLPVPQEAPAQWKLCISDQAHAQFTASLTGGNVSASDASVSVSYLGAPSGVNTFVSAILANEKGEAIFYGRLCAVDAAEKEAGTLEIALPAEVTGDCTLYLFSETDGGAYRSDAGSRLVALPLADVMQAFATPEAPPSVQQAEVTPEALPLEEKETETPRDTAAKDATVTVPGPASQSTKGLSRTLLPIVILAAVLICAILFLLLLKRRQGR